MRYKTFGNSSTQRRRTHMDDSKTRPSTHSMVKSKGMKTISSSVRNLRARGAEELELKEHRHNNAQRQLLELNVEMMRAKATEEQIEHEIEQKKLMDHIKKHYERKRRNE